MARLDFWDGDLRILGENINNILGAIGKGYYEKEGQKMNKTRS